MTPPDSQRVLGGADIPPALRALIMDVAARLMVGATATHLALQAQFARATLTSVELTGVGCFANFAYPDDVALVEPPHFSDGLAIIELAGVEHAADALLHVREGRLIWLEMYTFAGEPWPEPTVVLEIRDVETIVGFERGQTG